jgi:hypothetical protein
MVLNARRIHSDSGPELILLAIADITNQPSPDAPQPCATHEKEGEEHEDGKQ